jgi:hypothetical protein
MFMRLCVVILAGLVQGALAQTSDFEGQLASYQNRHHRDCQIKSPAMKLAYACSRIEAPDSNPRFYGTIDAGQPGSPSRSSNGVNFCYNALVDVQTNGDQVRISVLRDSGASARETRYQVNRSNLTGTGGRYLVPLDGLEGKCFTYNSANDVCSNGVFGIGNTHVPMALDLNFENGVHHSVTAERDAIKGARRNGSQLSSATGTNSEEAKKAAILYARKQMLARAKAQMSPKAGPPNAADKQCDEMLINMENSMKPELKRDPGEEAVLAEYRKRLSTPAPGGAPNRPADTAH